jgi:predicted amidohydrolase
MTLLKIACIQLNSSNHISSNHQQIAHHVHNAAAQGAQWIVTPENTGWMGSETDWQEREPNLFTLSHHPTLQFVQLLAQQTATWITLGSISLFDKAIGKWRNRSITLNPKGEITTYYDKIHLFDVVLPNGEAYLESQRFIAGNSAILAELPWTKVGFTICYDLRFPHLFRFLAQEGASVILVPSAFTYITGMAHWHSLLRARAIETGSYIIAPAQTGYHPGNRRTYGHSLIIDPWGEVILELSQDYDHMECCDIDLARVTQARQMIPSLQLQQDFKQSI